MNIKKFFVLAATIVAFAGSSLAQADDLPSLINDDKQWPMPSKNFAQTRYSTLNQINAGNAGQLRVAWTFSVGSNHGQEAAPIVIGDTMYVVGAYPNELFALDSVTGDMKWKYSPRVDPSSQGVACCDVVNRGEAYDNGKIFFNTLDDHTIAVDAKTGKEIWAVKLGEITKGMTITMAPLAAHGKVFVGNSGGEMGVRGWVTALDENTGKIVWRAYSVGPDKDVLIGPRFHPFYPSAKGKDLGVKTWPPGRWEVGGGPVWGWISYDPATNIIFYGTGNPGPWNSNQREGDNKWTTTIFARDADTGEALWGDQLNPHDLYDYDEINENLLLDLPINGKMTHVIVHPGRDGFMFVIDRQTGQIYSADKYDTQTSMSSFDLKTGRPVMAPELKPVLGKNIEGICPASPGVKDWQPVAYSPLTKLLYVPHQHLCMDYKTAEVGYIAGTPYVGATVDMYAGPGNYRGEFAAWDPTGRKKIWAIHEKFPVWSGTMVTSGNIAVYGTMDRWFKVVDARNGKQLYQFHAPSGFIGQPITYQGKDGNQYIAMLSGVGGWAGAIANAPLDPRVRNGALGYTGAMGDLPSVTSGGSTLMVFALPPKETPMRISLFALALCVPFAAQAGTLRVCSEPNNLPFSNRAGAGFENKLADIVARDMGDTVAYTYALQNDKFIKHTLDAHKCDVMMGVSVGMDGVLTTQPYYASTYVFVSRKADGLHLASLGDPRLRTLKIGVHLIGDDSTPPTLALGQEGIVNNIHGYLIYGDFAKPNPPARLIEAVENKDVDIAAVWGPLGGYFAKSSPVPLAVTPMTGTERFAPLQFRFAIAMGTRKSDTALRDKLNTILVREAPAIRNILVAYGVPLVELKGDSDG